MCRVVLRESIKGNATPCLERFPKGWHIYCYYAVSSVGHAMAHATPPLHCEDQVDLGPTEFSSTCDVLPPYPPAGFELNWNRMWAPTSSPFWLRVICQITSSPALSFFPLTVRVMSSPLALHFMIRCSFLSWAQPRTL